VYQTTLGVFVRLFDKLIDSGELFHSIAPELPGFGFLVLELQVAYCLEFLEVVRDLVRTVQNIPELVCQEELDVLSWPSVRYV
jgi:hypothetical protein